MPLMKVRLDLAREPGHPEGSSKTGYMFVAPLTADGKLDAAEWGKARVKCTVHRFWEGEGERDGHLVHVAGVWRFHYPGEEIDEDDPIYRLGAHRIVPGEYLSIDEDDDERHTFKIRSVEPV
jgi:hypothetical protein